MRRWLKAASIRAARTTAQAAIAVIGTSLIFDTDWPMVIATALTAGLLSFLTCVAGLPEVE